MRRNHFLSALWAVAIGGVVGCGDNTVSRTCGEGTTEVDGVCVSDGGTCGPGTISVGGECVPDGSVICGDGTTYDATSGECVPDPSVCGPGLVLDPITHTCVDEGVIAVDGEEGPEPNDGDTPTEFAGVIAVPAIGADPFVIHGCVNPYRDINPADGNPDIDFDYWVIDAAGPMALRVRADGVGGLAAGFVTLAGDQQLVDDGWQRFGVNLVNDTSEREMYLPKAGVYVIAMTDSRSLFLDAAGSPTACYYTSIEQIALPAATPGTITDTAGTDDGTLRVISFDPGDGDLFDNILDDGGKAALSGGIVVLKNGVYAVSAIETSDFFGPLPAETFAGGLSDTDTFEVVVDALYNYALTPQDYVLVTTQFTAQALPTDGSSITVVPNPGFFNFLYFDVGAAGEIDNFDVTFSRSLDFVRIADANLNVIANIAQGGPLTPSFSDEFVRFLAPGRYYFMTADSAATPADTYDVTGTLVAQVPSALVTGTPVTDAAVPATGSAFHTFDPTGNGWAGLNAATASGGATISLGIYDEAAGGWLDNGYNAVGTLTFAADGSDTYEHIFFGDPSTYLARLQPATPGGATTYDASVTALPFVDLGTIVAGTPLDRAGDSFGAFEYARYVASAGPATLMSITASPNAATPNLDIIMQSLPDTFLTEQRLRDVDFLLRADTGLDGDPETLSTGATFPGDPGFVAFAVADYFGDPGTVDIHIDATAPQPYDVTTGTLAFTDACAGGSVLAQTPVGPFAALGDEAVTAAQTMPFAFELHGSAVSSFYVSTNGFLAFEPSVNDAYFSNQALPSSAPPGNLVAAYWDDLELVEICRFDTASSVTIQWVGARYADPVNTVAAQAVLNDDLTIDFIYGATQVANGASGSVGTEVPGFGTQVVFNMAGTVLPSTSTTLTPSP